MIRSKSVGPQDMMTLNETVELLRLRRNTVADLARRGELPGRKVGAEWRFSRQALLRWVEKPCAQAR